MVDMELIITEPQGEQLRTMKNCSSQGSFLSVDSPKGTHCQFANGFANSDSSLGFGPIVYSSPKLALKGEYKCAIQCIFSPLQNLKVSPCLCKVTIQTDFGLSTQRTWIFSQSVTSIKKPSNICKITV